MGKFRRRVQRFALIIGIGYGASMVAEAFVEARLNPYSVRLSALDSSEPFPGLRQSNESHVDLEEISQSLVLDSILTIIQNYYVDVGRTRSRDLLDQALYALTETNDVRLRSLDNERFIVSTGGDQIEIETTSDYSYDDLVSHALKISKLLEDDPKRKVDQRKSTSDSSDRGSIRFLTALLQSLDPHSTILNKEDYRDLRQGTEGTFGGLGVVVGMQDDLLTVIKPLPASPASKVGIFPNDKIMSINDVMTFGSSLDHLVQHMRGEPGSTVELSLLREGEYAPLSVTLKREIIQVASIEFEIRSGANQSGRVLHIVVESFSSRTAQEIYEAVTKNHREKPLDGIILDLRSNPGGLLDQAVQVSDLFLASGDIVSTIGRRQEVEKAYRDLRDIKLPLIVLINNETASASEIVAGAIQDNNRGLIVGQPSFGKGSVQTVFELPGEQALKLTIARYYTPKGRSIQSIGIIPDIWIQPIYQNSENLNLLGPERYRNESFLSHALSKDTTSFNPEKSGFSPYKGYYLANYEQKSDDYILKFADQLFQDLLIRNSKALSEEHLRATYWLANSHEFIESYLRVGSEKVQQWLQSKFNISWDSFSKRSDFSGNIQLKVNLPDEVNVEEGGILEVPWTLSNFTTDPIERLSLYALPDNVYLQSQEILLGKLDSGKVQTGVLKIPVPISSMHKDFNIHIGIAANAWPYSLTAQTFNVNITPREHPSLVYKIELQDENGGQFSGVIEPGEEATLKVTLSNQSALVARSVQTELINLTGQQISFNQLDRFKPFELLPKTERSINLKIKASDRLTQDKLAFGVSISSIDLLKPIKSSFIMNGMPGIRAASR